MDSAAAIWDALAPHLGRIPHIFSWEYGRYVVGAGGVFLVVWVILKPFLKTRKIREKTPRAPQMWREVLASTRTALIFTAATLVTFAGLDAGLMEIYADAGKYGTAYWVASLILIIVVHDAYFYWTHRLMHVRGFMKYIHWQHHRSMNPSPFAAYSFDIPEAIVHASFVPLFLLVFPVHGLVMFIWSAHMIIRNGMGHSGFELFPRSWAVHPFFGLLTNVTHHDMHHSNGNYNFGLYFSWWDRLMGTEHPDYLKRTTGEATVQRRTIASLLPIQRNA